jgi:hypothetical protein
MGKTKSRNVLEKYIDSRNMGGINFKGRVENMDPVEQYEWIFITEVISCGLWN